MAEGLWLLIVFGGPLLLGAAIAYALLTRRATSTGEDVARRRAVRSLYEDDEPAGATADGKGASPAAQSLRAERARTQGQSDLEEGLEETFPASDPVSATSTTTTGARRPDERR